MFWGLAGVAAAAALAYWLVWSHRDDPGPLGAAVKTASTASLALLLATGLPAPWFWLMPLGLALGALGDLCLALRGERLFLAGVAAFGLGHLAYAAGLALRAGAIGFDGISAGEGLALAVLAGLLISTEVWLAPRTGALRLPVRLYVGLIGLMGAVAVLLPDTPGQWTLRIGAALFILSDLLLSLRLFVVTDPARQRGLSLVLWPAYWLGQALIGWGAVLLWSFPKG